MSEVASAAAVSNAPPPAVPSGNKLEEMIAIAMSKVMEPLQQQLSVLQNEFVAMKLQAEDGEITVEQEAEVQLVSHKKENRSTPY